MTEFLFKLKLTPTQINDVTWNRWILGRIRGVYRLVFFLSFSHFFYNFTVLSELNRADINLQFTLLSSGLGLTSDQLINEPYIHFLKPNISIPFYALGGTSALHNEMQNAITSKSAYKKYQGRGISSGTGNTSISNIEVTMKYPLVSFITMIAPSPDWFVGVHDYNLCNTTTGKWEASRTRDLPPYDAGTDSGPHFESHDINTNPPELIHILTNNTNGSFKGDKPVRRFGTFKFVKTFDSNTVSKPSSTKQAPSSTMRQSWPSDQMTPTFTTTSMAYSVKNHCFIYIVFTLIFVNFFL